MWGRGILERFIRGWFRARCDAPPALADVPAPIYVARHDSDLTAALLAICLPGRPVPFVCAQTARGRLRRLLRLAEHRRVDFSDAAALDEAARLVAAGRPVILFPERGRVDAERLDKVYDDAASLALATGAPLVAARVDGIARTRFADGAHLRRQWRPRLTVRCGDPVSLPPAGAGEEDRRRGTTRVQALLQRQLYQATLRPTLFDGLLSAAARYRHAQPVVADVRGSAWGYGQLVRHSLMLGRIAARLTAPGENVGVLMPNAAVTPCLVVGLTAFGRVPAMLNYTVGSAGLLDACALAGVRTVLTSRAFLQAANLTDTVAQLDGVRVVHMEDFRRFAGLGDWLWLHGFARHFPRRAAPAQAPDSPAVVLFTSGSESKPKGVVLSHRALMANIAQVRGVLDYTRDDHFFNALPIFHSFGLTVGSLLPVMTGARLFMYPSPLHYRAIPDWIHRQGCTVLFGSSTFLGHYGKQAHPYDFRQLRFAVAGAEKLAESVRQLWTSRFGVRILEGYGVTESAPVISVNTPVDNRVGSVGRLVPELEARLQPVEGIAEGGVLHVKGPNVMLGYYRHDRPGVVEPVGSVFGPGWYDTGDVAALDADGFLRIVGRVKRFAKVAGEMVPLEHTQALAAEVSPGCQHASSAQSDPRRGETIVLFTTDAALTRDALLRQARAQGVPEIAVAKKIIPVEQLPVLGTGKIDYVSLKRMAEDAARSDAAELV